jgi:hypothetical protein
VKFETIAAERATNNGVAAIIATTDTAVISANDDAERVRKADSATTNLPIIEFLPGSEPWFVRE